MLLKQQNSLSFINALCSDTVASFFGYCSIIIKDKVQTRKWGREPPSFVILFVEAFDLNWGRNHQHHHQLKPKAKKRLSNERENAFSIWNGNKLYIKELARLSWKRLSAKVRPISKRILFQVRNFAKKVKSEFHQEKKWMHFLTNILESLHENQSVTIFPDSLTMPSIISASWYNMRPVWDWPLRKAPTPRAQASSWALML